MSKQNEIQLQDACHVPASVTPMQPDSPLQLMRVAIESGNVEALERLQGLYERHEDREAKKAFTVALARFHKNCPPLYRIKDGLKTKDGRVVNKFAPLDYILRTIREAAQDNGLSWRWPTKPHEDGERLYVTCVLMHESGHSEEATMLTRPTGTTLTNEMQKDGGGLSYAKRYTLLACLGLEQEGEDTEAVPQNEPLSQDLLKHYTATIRELGMDERGLCEWLGVEVPPDITVSHIPKLERAIAAKRRSKAKGGQL